jgi:hypothetical protein
MMRNLRTTLKTRSATMDDFDRLPPKLRGWLADAALPWSTRAARRIWQRALAETRSEAAALARLRAAEARTLARERIRG